MLINCYKILGIFVNYVLFFGAEYGMINLSSLHCITFFLQNARSTVQTEQAMNFGKQSHGAGPLQWWQQMQVQHICGTVVCSIGVFFIP